jgi:hypothetical protein
MWEEGFSGRKGSFGGFGRRFLPVRDRILDRDRPIARPGRSFLSLRGEKLALDSTSQPRITEPNLAAARRLFIILAKNDTLD